MLQLEHEPDLVTHLRGEGLALGRGRKFVLELIAQGGLYGFMLRVEVGAGVVRVGRQEPQ